MYLIVNLQSIISMNHYVTRVLRLGDDLSKM